MTDKQIIIDGVDVSGCYQYMPRHMEDYDIDTLDYCGHYFKPCKDVDAKYCYYKQLKRKEQECERLKKQHQGDKGLITSTGKMNYQLIQEYDKLKTDLTEIKEIAEQDILDYYLQQILQKISEVEL